MRIVIAILCVFSLVMVACGDDDDGETSLETFCEKNEELDRASAELFAPPFDETPEEVEAIATESVAIAQDMEAAAPEEIQDTMAGLVSYETFADVMEQNGWDIEASGDEIDALIEGVDPALVDEYGAYLAENCTTETEPSG